jgi:hypothetical protein
MLIVIHVLVGHIALILFVADIDVQAKHISLEPSELLDFMSHSFI